jgi:ATP-binding cassette, subfamily B, bacterial CvaB/MchF/RaxB
VSVSTPTKPLRFNFSRRLPIVLQVEAAECGLACLAMVSSYYGQDTDLASLRRKFSISLKGASLKSILEIAKGMQLATRPVKVELERLRNLKTPSILHWDMNHFVVMRGFRGGKLAIHDPAVGLRSLSMEEVSRHFTGVAIELSPTTDFRPSKTKTSFSFFGLMGRITGLKRSLLQIFLLSITLEAAVIISPFYLQWIIDQALVSADKDLLMVLALGFVLLVLIQAAIGSFRSWVISVVSVSLNYQWLGNSFAHLLKLPLDWFEKRHLGDITSKFGSISTIQRTLTLSFVQTLVDGLLVVGTFSMMLLYSPKLAALSVVAVLLYGATRWFIYGPLCSATTEQIVHAAKQQTHFLETARGAQCVRLFGRGEERRIGWLNMLAEQFNAELKIQKIGITYQTADTILFGVERIIVIWFAAALVLDKQFTVGMMLAFVSYKEQFSHRIASLIDKLFELKMLRLHGERVADIVMTAPETGDEQLVGELDFEGVEPAISMRGVTFSYSPTEPVVLKKVDLEIAAGECVAITGASGCGKTTLVKVMLGLLRPNEGGIYIGGHSICQLGLENYRRMIGTVMQDDSLFTGSIADNISFFDPTPNQSLIEDCAKIAAIHTEICDMPMGFNTLISDQGIGLSGGQRQRVLLSRALYRRPKILVLDEATSHLDILNERCINDAIKGMSLTRIIIAHRPETIAMASRVVVVRDGVVL